MKLVRIIALIFALALPMSFALPASPSYAADSPFITDDYCKNGEKADRSAYCQDNSNSVDNPLTGQDGTIMRIVNLVALVGGIAAVFVIIISGFRFITSGGGDNAANARRALIYAAIGLVVIALARTVIAFVIGKI